MSVQDGGDPDLLEDNIAALARARDLAVDDRIMSRGGDKRKTGRCADCSAGDCTTKPSIGRVSSGACRSSD